jgi:hypothetical protein
MTIPSTPTQLLVTEDWKKIYQSFRNADFQSYDYETIRRILISYLQENYPEDFNDFIDSSEYIALVDLIAYLGQNLSFRIDLNARENFLETAQRRDSILRLAQLISYVPKRNIPASGLLKITAISTTDSITDSTGVNLAGTTISWNDPTNTNWYNQFISIINSAMPAPTTFGKPNDHAKINGISTDQYLINSSNPDVPIYSFSKNVNGTSMSFEIVPATFKGQSYIYESTPSPASPVSVLYQNDNQGSGSPSTGFFALFKQGTLGFSNFSITNPVANEIIGINVSNINNTDVWLWQLNNDGSYPSTPWTKVPAVVGTNVIYNNIASNIRNLYSVTSRDSDQIDLNFTDGSFGDLPKGNFNLYYRQSNGLTYAIKPEQMSGIVINVPYINQSGQSQTLTLTLGLQYTVSNSSAPESNATIQRNAPQSYYTQARMVTGEDYNIAPLTYTSNVLKIKSTNRVSSGISKYYELSDVSGKYSSTNIFATDGILYKNTHEKNFSFTFSSRNQILSVIKKQLEPIVASPALKSFYIDTYRSIAPVILNPDTTTLISRWHSSNVVSGQSRGYFVLDEIRSGKVVQVPISVGSLVSYPYRHISAGSMIKFVPPVANNKPQYFLPNGKITPTKSSKTTDYIWVTAIQVIGDGANGGLGNLNDGTGPVVLSDQLGDGAIPVEIIPSFIDTFSYNFENSLVNLCLTQRNFGLSYNVGSRSWTIIEDTNLDLTNPFSTTDQGNNSNSNKDSSWLIAFTWNGDRYKVRYRITDFVFQSAKQTGFYVDPTDVNFDFTTNSVIKDKINVLALNTKPGINTSSQGLGKDYSWQINSPVTEVDGYTDPSKVLISFYSHQDSGTIGQIIDPDSFNNIVGTSTANTSDGYVMYQVSTDGMTVTPVDNLSFVVFPTEADAITYYNTFGGLNSDYLYYFTSTNVVKKVNGSAFVLQPGYVVYPGRAELSFHYLHNSGHERRIDPSKSNIVDIYMLTADYDTAFRNWLLTGAGTKPLPPTSQSLENNYSSDLEPIKTISDEIVYQPVTYKILFGSNADITLRATFKAVINPNSTASKNNIVSRILSAINTFFALENWEFGQSFYFSELSTYVMNLLSPDITNFIMVPTVNNFGSLYEINCQNNEIFISGATAADIEVISAVTASQLNTDFIVTNAG